jgi:hypothetical protein
MSDPVNELRTVGRDLSDVRKLSPTFTTPKTRVPASIAKSALLLVNSPTSYRLNLGTGPVNDAVAVGGLLKDFGFDVYFLVHPRAADLLRILDAFFANTTGQFVLFYAGHGHGVLEELDEAFDPAHAFVFADGAVREDELLAHLAASKNPTNEVVLIADACIAGTIWDIQGGTVKDRQLPPGVLSISSTGDPLAIRPAGDRQQNGVFTVAFTQALRAAPEITPAELARKIAPAIRGIGRNLVVGTSSKGLLTQPLFEY